MTVYLSLLVSIIGLLMYALCVNAKLAEIGRLLFFAGALAFLIAFGEGRLLSLPVK